MSVKIKGDKALVAELERRIGKMKAQQLSDKALKRGAQVFIKELERQFESFKKTGASIEEMKISEPMWVAGVRTVKVYWRGPKERYQVIHLNEFGTVQNPNPKGKGSIARTMRIAENAYREAIKKAIREGI
ncbi:HK97-gp10 family putative phage morphogenesis protein [Peribacillus muralis]|uniref:HK97-gp10 family putative phage morphogenesis protein n=1 Tax=Peribacillus muralis TaxID=264697 RepID=UPI003CFF4073